MAKKGLAVQNNVGVDDFYTPAPAINPLLPYLPKEWLIWECAAGSGNLSAAFETNGYKTISTDILQGIDFRMFEPEKYDCIITNPPYSLKDEFLERAYQLGKPFALLIPITSFEGKVRQRLFRNYGVEVILFDKRINFECPNPETTKEKSGSWFPTAWFTWGLNLPKQLNFVKYKE